MGSRLFSYGDVKGRPSRAGFDLSKKFCFTAKAGELLPVYWKMFLPGTKVNLKDMHFTRTMPVNTAAYTRIKEYFDWYFVPLRLINKNLNPALVNMLDQSNIATSLIQNKVVSDEIPYTDFSTITECFKAFDTSGEAESNLDIAGFKRITQSIKLMRYLRYGNFLYDTTVGTQPNKNMGYSGVNDFNIYAKWNLNVNILPLAAYQKIYCDYFRFEQWEKAQPYAYNFDYYSGGNILTEYENSPFDLLAKDNLFSLRYANYLRDLFMGILPSSQLGSVATVNVVGVNGFSGIKLGSAGGNLTGTVATDGTTVTISNSSSLTPAYTSLLRSGLLGGSTVATFDILSFRVASAIQRMREIQQCAGQGYKEQLEARWNVKLSTALSDHCTYIGGNSSQINISEVLNNNLDTAQSQADIKGKGVGSGSGSEFFETPEHGILMCIYHSAPVLDYQLTGCDLQLLNTYATDLPQPELDNLGLEALPYFALINDYTHAQPSNVSEKTILGYVPRYIAYKTDVDFVDGAFLTTLTSWVTPLTIAEIVSKVSLATSTGPWSINYGFFKVSPRVLDSIFVTPCNNTVDTDQFLVEAFFDVKVVQNLDYDGMPY